MKLILALLLAVPSFAAGITLTIDPAQIKTGLTQPNKWHRAVFIFEALGAITSLGLDGGSTEFVKSHSQLWVASCGCYVAGAHETDPLFLNASATGPVFSQTKFWLWKSALAIAPVAVSKVAHKIAPDNIATDAAIIGITGTLSGFYTYAAINNLHIASQITAENKAAGH